MKKRIFKKIHPIQYLYPNNTDIYQYIEDIYTVFEGIIDGTPICFYNRTSSILKTTNDNGKTFSDTPDSFISPSYFVSVDKKFDEIIDSIIAPNEGIVTEITES